MIAVCLTVHGPNPARLERQLASLHAQQGAERPRLWARTLLERRPELEPGKRRALERAARAAAS